MDSNILATLRVIGSTSYNNVLPQGRGKRVQRGQDFGRGWSVRATFPNLTAAAAGSPKPKKRAF